MARRLLLGFIACVGGCGHTGPDPGIDWIPRGRDDHTLGTVRVRNGELLDLEIQILREWKRPPSDHCVFDFNACNGGPQPGEFLVENGAGRLCARATCGNEVEDLLAVGAPVTLQLLQGLGAGRTGWSEDDGALSLDKLVAHRDQSRRVIFQTTCHA